MYMYVHVHLLKVLKDVGEIYMHVCTCTFLKRCRRYIHVHTCMYVHTYI